MKSSSFLPFLLIALLLLFSSCFEIIEEVNIDKDGSGTFCYTINMSQSRLQLNSMFLLDSVNGRPMPKKEDLTAEFDKIETALKEAQGLSNISTKRNWDDYIFSISGNFSNVDALNLAINKMNALFSKRNKTKTDFQDNFAFSNNTFTRLYNYNLVSQYNSLSEKDKAVFDNAKYTTIYRFSSPVGTYSNSEAKVSKSGKAVMLKINIKDLITNKKTIKNSINLK